MCSIACISKATQLACSVLTNMYMHMFLCLVCRFAPAQTEKSKENEIRAEEHSVESRRAQFLKSLEAEGEQAKAFLSKVCIMP